MACNRPDVNEWWRPTKQHEDWRLFGIGDTFSTWCNSRLDTELPARCTAWGEDLERYYPALAAKGVWGDTNFEANGWDKAHCSSGSSGRCTVKRPLENNKYACCTNGKISVLQCGKMWCKEDTANCDTYMGAYCSSGTRLIDDANCYAKFQISKITEINQMCSQPENVTKPSCRDFCQNQIASDGGFIGTCHAAAGAYCAKTENASKPECECINYAKSPEYRAFISKLPNGDAGIPNPQCWSNACVTGNALKSTSTCPTNMALCIQALETTNTTTQNLGRVGSDCNIQLQTSSTTSLAVPPPPSVTTPPSAPSASSPPPGSSSPPGVSVSQSPSPSPSASEALSPGAIAAIVIGGFVLLILILKGAGVI